jgi:NADH-quinone oxidoreductase subunit J
LEVRVQDVFYISAVIAAFSTALVIMQSKAVHALLYLIVSLISVAIMFFSAGAPFVAALQVIIYAGAIMVLFVFVIMMLNLGDEAARQEKEWLAPGIWIGPSILTAILLFDLIYMLLRMERGRAALRVLVGPKAVGIALFGPYMAGVELASLLLLAGLVGAYHLGTRSGPGPKEKEE